VACLVLELDEQSTLLLVEYERADRDPLDGLEPFLQGTEPPETRGVRDRSVRGGGRREDEETGVAERSILRPVVGALAERAAVGLLADECDPAWPELAGDVAEAVGGAREVGAAQVARPWRRAGGRVGRADAVLEELVTPIPSSSRENCSAGR